MTDIYICGDPRRHENYRRAIAAAGGEARFDGDPLACGGLLLPGGGDMEPWRYGQVNTASRDLEPERDQLELELVDAFTAVEKPVLGICRGHQVLNVFFGGTLLQDLPGHNAVDGKDRRHEVRTASSFLRDLYGERCMVNSAHHQAVDRLGSGLEALQWTGDGTVEALRHRALPIWGVQWHPERLRPTGDRLFEAFLAVCLGTG